MSTNPQRRSRLLALAVIVIALGVGGLAGATLDRALVRQQEPAPAEAPAPAAFTGPGQMAHGERGGRAPGRVGMREAGPGTPARPSSRYLDWLTRELGLSAEQQQRIEVLLLDQQERMRMLRQEHVRQRGAIVAETRAGILELLAPDQRARLDSLDRAQPRRPGPAHRPPGE